MSTWKETLFGDPFAVEGDEIDENAQSEAELLAKGNVFEQPPATRGELWGYYLYYNGDNGFTMNSYMPSKNIDGVLVACGQITVLTGLCLQIFCSLLRTWAASITMETALHKTVIICLTVACVMFHGLEALFLLHLCFFIFRPSLSPSSLYYSLPSVHSVITEDITSK